MQPPSINSQYGQYQIVELLDAAPDSALYHAMNTVTGSLVMLRVLSVRRDRHEQRTIDGEMKRCLDELEIVRNIHHPHLLPILDVQSSGPHVFFAMPIKSGGNLSHRMYGRPDFSYEESLAPIRLPSLGETTQLILQLGHALQALHEAGHSHGQVEPGSVYTQGREVFLGNAGLLRLNKIIFRLDTTSSFDMTRYSAPEVWGAERSSPASDQYALACLAYEMVTGRFPFDSQTLLGLMDAHLNGSVPPPHLIRPDLKLPQELSFIFWQALAKPVNERFDHIGMFVDAFALCVRGREGEPTDFFE